MPFEILIFSTMSGRQWEGKASSSDLEEIFREFNRVDEADNARLEALGYDLPSLSSGDFVRVNDRWWLCANVGWVEVDDRQAIIPQLDYANARKLDRDARPPMFLEMCGSTLVYMMPSGKWKSIPAQSATEVHDEHPYRGQA